VTAPLRFAVLLLAGLSFAGCREAPRVERPDILVLSLDTTRADRLGIYGHSRPTSPVLDALAREGAWFERAYTTATWTLPSHASLFTGKYPTSHGARYDADGPLALGAEISGPEAFEQIRARGLAPDEQTLAVRLREAGYRTGGVVAGPWLKSVFGLGRGFEHWDDAGITSVNGRPAVSVTDAAIAWLDASADARPFFLFLNYFDPHNPFYPPARFVEQVAPPEERPIGEARNARDIAVLYDAEIRAMDFHIGRLLDHLRAKGRYDATFVVAVADHGELFGEQNGHGHGASLFEPELRIPLIVKPPHREPPHGRQDALIQISDVFPMLLARAGVALPADVQAAFPPPPGRPAFAEVNPLPGFGKRGDWRAVLEGPWKYLESGAGDRLLFDLSTDPGETTDLASRHPEVAERLRAALHGWITTLPAPPLRAGGAATQVDDATRRALESLGYLHGDEPKPAPPGAD
jgi:arylsulfatase A-like enzyme